jgi:octaprenyl-diphosphate synthase|tara:strand:+ start:1546 stop:2568 length:1023 start_codon:yes stop_codon:yes gene_type:complete
LAVVTKLPNTTDSNELTALDALRNLCAADMERVNQLILHNMESNVPLIPQLAGHLIAAGGKRLRPLLTLASAGICNYRGKNHISLATAVEFIHTATLLHDDVVDDSGLRRGRDTANSVWGNQSTVLVGDFLFSRAFRLMVQSDSIRVLDILANASAVIAEGEVAQLTTANNTDTEEDSYLNVISSKTAALFAAACQIGAVIGERPSQEENALYQYGLNLGIAFQLVDDYLDYGASDNRLGKDVGDDFREGKITLPVILAFRRGKTEEQDFWRRTLENLDQNKDDFNYAQKLLNEHKALSETQVRARGYTETARTALNVFPQSPYKKALEEVVDFCVDRSY